MEKGETLNIIVYTPQKYIFVNTRFNYVHIMNEFSDQF